MRVQKGPDRNSKLPSYLRAQMKALSPWTKAWCYSEDDGQTGQGLLRPMPSLPPCQWLLRPIIPPSPRELSKSKYAAAIVALELGAA
jgi:hypothetical protein